MMSGIQKLMKLLNEGSEYSGKDIREYSKIFGFDAEKEIARKEKEGKIKITREGFRGNIVGFEGDFDAVIDLSDNTYILIGVNWSVDVSFNDTEYRVSVYKYVCLGISNGNVVAYIPPMKREPKIEIEDLEDYDDYFEDEDDRKVISYIENWAESYFSDLGKLKKYFENDSDNLGIKDDVERCFTALKSGWYKPIRINIVVDKY